jgi:hypothetical protein
MKRREFIGKAAFGMVAAGLSTPFAKKVVAGQEQQPKIIYRTLGRTDLRIPIVSFGVMNSDSPDLIQRSLDMGINHLDTAHVYLRGNSERVIGEVVPPRKICSSNLKQASNDCAQTTWTSFIFTAAIVPRW